MAAIYFFRDKKGNQPVKQYMVELAEKKDKDSRVKLNKIQEYIEILGRFGTRIGEPYIKHLDGDGWELRPSNVRILFTVLPNGYILLHSFIKQSKKTPIREIEKAKREIEEMSL